MEYICSIHGQTRSQEQWQLGSLLCVVFRNNLISIFFFLMQKLTQRTSDTAKERITSCIKVYIVKICFVSTFSVFFFFGGLVKGTK